MKQNNFRRTLAIEEAARRLRAQDHNGGNGHEMFVAASGGYGAAARNQLLHDIRTLIYAAIDDQPSGFDAA